MISWFINKLSDYGNNKSIVEKDIRYSYAELSDAITEMKEYISINNINSRQVVSIISDYSFKSIALFFSLLDNGNIVTLITNKAEEEISKRVTESYSDVRIIQDKDNFEILPCDDFREKHKLIKDLQDNNNSGLILFTSGSTGVPKAMIYNMDDFLYAFKKKQKRHSNILIFLMFDHIGGLNTLLNALASGSTIVIPEKRDAYSICRIIEKYKIDLLPTSPTFLNLILMSETYKKCDLSSLKLITYGTEVMPEDLLKKLINIFPNTKFLQTFGTSETGIAKTSSKSYDSTFMRIENGSMAYKIVNGELWLKSRNQILGYLNADSDESFEDGWYKTGDLVEESQDGYFRIVGRLKERINIGGNKVFPEEIESILLNMPIISYCLVYGEPNTIMGQIIVAEVVLKKREEEFIIKKKIREFCINKIDSYKIPTKIVIVDKIPFSERFKKYRPGFCGIGNKDV